MYTWENSFGAVYIFENPERNCVKVGYTGNTNDIASRLNYVKDVWTERLVKCQICGIRVVRSGFIIPKHGSSRSGCPGGNQLPFELDVKLAKEHLDDLKNQITSVGHTKKGSLRNRIKNLEQKIEFYKTYKTPIGRWYFDSAYLTKEAKRIEGWAHHFLHTHLDQNAPIGEVFNCSSKEAKVAIEKSLSKLGLNDLVKIVTNMTDTE